MDSVESDTKVPNIRAKRFALLTGPHTCCKCGDQTRVSAIGLADHEEFGEEGYEPVEDCRLFTQLRALKADVASQINGLAPWLRFDYSMAADTTYLANHCEHCDALIGAWYIAEPGEAFFPLSDEEVGRLAVEWIDQPFEITDGGGMQNSWIDKLLMPDRPDRPKRKPRRRA